MTQRPFSHDGVFYGLLALVLIAPLPFGGILPSAWLPMALAAGFLLAVFAGSHLHAHTTPPVSVRPFRIPLILLGIVVAWGFIQTLPAWPESLAHPVWNTVSDTLGQPLKGRLSVTPDAGLDILLRWLTNLAVFWLALNYGRKSGNVRTLLQVIAISATFCAAYGLLMQGSHNPSIFGMTKIHYRDSLTGTFINKNHAATFLGLGILCALSLFIHQLSSIPSSVGPREKLRLLGQKITGRHALPLICLALLIPAIFLTDSRAGIAITILAAIALIIMARLTKSIGRTPFRILLGAGLLPALLFLLLGKETNLAYRIGFFGQDWEIRMHIYAATLKALAITPWAGTGLGSFASIFRMYHDGSMSGAVTEAHNTYLELALELGLPMTGLLLAACLWPVALCARGMLIRQENRLLPVTGLAAALLCGIHAMFDFSLQMPGLALVFWALMGACTAQAWSMRKSI